MIPEALRHYLVIRRFDEDVVQDVILDYLTSTVPIRYPKAWGWKAAQRYAAARRRSQARHVASNGPSSTLVDPLTLTPDRRAEVMQELARAFTQGPPKRKKGRPRNDGFEGCWEDYRVLQREG